MVLQAKEARDQGRSQVAAVLTAALFEDVIRSLAREKLNLSDCPKLEEVLSLLKQGGVVKGGEHTTMIGYIKFRNDALHADWEKVGDV